ncbi:MAG: hypothetical protein IPM83_16200 [Ignavibacteria bacterium]|nr:hypothetical protein [Ignavibacteria bacterium]
MSKAIQARRCVRIPTHELNEELMAMLERTPPPASKRVTCASTTLLR